ncbi:efflux RND transporter periplasmic adaptor subunit [candidate division WWE3 bacterium]|uniref:Efflux RND transporter periplasmic adaptor subunit n=1 Tax=candidate division WWE3 bacterium TaxID=2053526 RepID=A0A3A4ZAZ4_UNCKA|nr:MAG: efflux RND transporter periplasmic adaptor subunit [candidate division WWE3 bacterium]
MKIKRSYILILIVVLVLVLAVRYFTSPKVKSLQVKETKIENRVVNKTVSASGAIKSKSTVNLSFPSTQVISQITVKEGEKVTQGQILAYLESSIQYQSTQAVRDARDIVLRKRDLFVSDRETNEKTLGGSDQYEIRLRQYNEEVSQAEASYQAELARFQNYYITAPFTGTVVDITKEVGETAATGEAIIKMSNLEDLYFEINVDQEDYGSLKIGQSTEISLDAYGNRKFQGTVSELSLYAGDIGDFTVKIEFEESGEFLPSLGLTGDAKIVVDTTSQEVPSLYYDEVFYDEEDRPFVWVVRNGYLSKYPVEIGLEGDIYTEIKSSPEFPIVIGLNQDIELAEGYKAAIVPN